MPINNQNLKSNVNLVIYAYSVMILSASYRTFCILKVVSKINIKAWLTLAPASAVLLDLIDLKFWHSSNTEEC